MYSVVGIVVLLILAVIFSPKDMAPWEIEEYWND
jgi:hypothetical protein